jgi:phosphoesterase RecJ-like protein
MKWQKEEDSLNIYLDTDKNLKFEFIEIINGLPKPDLIIVVDTADVQTIDSVYDNNTELFFEVPILSIDHHPGNEYFGTINLIDLTATSTAEILVSLFEALGIKIDNPDIATCLLAGILYDTQSFRGKNTTPKSLTVAAQLLAAGGRQQEIISNFYNNKKPVELLRVWNKLLSTLEIDKENKFAWTAYDAGSDSSVGKDDVFSAGEDLLTKNPDADMVLILFRGSKESGTIYGQLNSRNKDVQAIAQLFNGTSNGLCASFEVKESDIDNATKIVIKKLAGLWGNQNTDKKELWDVIENPAENPQPETKVVDKIADVISPKIIEPVAEKPNSVKEKEDAIEEALKSISQIERDENRREMESLRDVIDRKKIQGLPIANNQEQGTNGDLDVFGDE